MRLKDVLLYLANWVLLLCLVLFLASLQTALWPSLFGRFPSPSLWVPVLVYFSLYRSTFAAAIFSYLVAIVLSPFTATPESQLMLICLGIAIATQLFKFRIYWPRSSYAMLVCTGAAAAFYLFQWALSWMGPVEAIARPRLLYWGTQVLLTPLVAPAIFALLRWIDHVTQRDQAAELTVEVS